MSTLPASTELLSERTEQHKAHGANWLAWLGHLSGKPDVRGLELGCWLGESTEWFAEHICTGDRASIETIDHFEGSEEHRLGGIDCLNNERTARERLARFGERAVVRKGDTGEIMRHLYALQYRYDFGYVDATHAAMNVLRDSVFTFDLLKPGGIIVWDDYKWEVMKDEVDRPKIAIDGFLAAYARRLEVVSLGGWQVCARKLR